MQFYFWLPGLSCTAVGFLGCGEQGLLSSCVRVIMGSRCRAQGSRVVGLAVVHELSCPVAVEFSGPGNQTTSLHWCCIQPLTTREVQKNHFIVEPLGRQEKPVRSWMVSFAQWLWVCELSSS